jgi:flagellar basal-body rod protein FlgB
LRKAVIARIDYSYDRTESMPSVNLFALASQQAEWLATKRSVITANVANANTPGYRAKEIADFKSLLDPMAVNTTSTNARHITTDGMQGMIETDETSGAAGEVYHSGNAVNLDQEFLKAGDVARQQSLNVGVVRAFHRMLLASAKA